MAKNYITIGSEYASAFESICLLTENGSVDREVVERVNATHTEIETAGHIFRYDAELRYIRTDEEIGMKGDGATWFKAFRGQKVNNDMAVWHNLIERVASNYHKNYSLFECDHRYEKLSAEKLSTYANMGRKIVSALWPEMTDISVVEGDSETGLENIYCVFLRMSVSGGTGEARPVLCKVFFRQEKDKFVPIISEEAKTVSNELVNIAQKTSDSASLTSDSSMIALALTALESLTSDDSGQFNRCVLIENEEDCETINEMVKKGPNEFVMLECSEIKPLGIAHVRWCNDSVVIMRENRPVFYLTADESSEKITLRCASCNGEPIIRNGYVRIIGDDGEELKYEINPAKDNLGLSAKDLAFVRENSVVKEHYGRIKCSVMERRLGKACVKFVCSPNAQNFGSEENPLLRCADCPYPEIVYTDSNGEKKLTADLVYAKDKRDLVDKNGVFTCSLCGGTFTRSASKKVSGTTGEKFCSFCANIIKKLNDDSAPSSVESETYRRYAKALPISARLTASKNRKFAFERDDIIFFIVGEKVYGFNKWSLTDGKVNSPVLYRKRSN